jgi:hypothetical protein
MTSAEAAITWVNHGIHPDEFTVQTRTSILGAIEMNGHLFKLHTGW